MLNIKYKLHFCSPMQFINEISWLIGREFKTEMRQRYALNGVLLYGLTTVFVCYLSFGTLKPIAWISLYWVLMLFTAVNAITKSFTGEQKSQVLYTYTLASGSAVILSKIIYNFLLLNVLALFTLLFYSLLLGYPVQDTWGFLGAIILGNAGLSTSLTMTSAISFKAGSSSSLMAILSFPVIIPTLLLSIKLSKQAMDNLEAYARMDEMGQLGGIILISGALSMLLFPYLWRD